MQSPGWFCSLAQEAVDEWPLDKETSFPTEISHSAVSRVVAQIMPESKSADGAPSWPSVETWKRNAGCYQTYRADVVSSSIPFV